jgi:hypothetical protein
MGMFDTVINGYKPMGEEALNKVFQTKDLDCCMETYWISPAGELFRKDMTGASRWQEDKEDLFGGHFVPNGKHGKLVPFLFTGGVSIYRYDLEYHQGATEFDLLFKHGKIIYFERSRTPS